MEKRARWVKRKPLSIKAEPSSLAALASYHSNGPPSAAPKRFNSRQIRHPVSSPITPLYNTSMVHERRFSVTSSVIQAAAADSSDKSLLETLRQWQRRFIQKLSDSLKGAERIARLSSVAAQDLKSAAFDPFERRGSDHITSAAVCGIFGSFSDNYSAGDVRTIPVRGHYNSFRSYNKAMRRWNRKSAKSVKHKARKRHLS